MGLKHNDASIFDLDKTTVTSIEALRRVETHTIEFEIGSSPKANERERSPDGDPHVPKESGSGLNG
jgi:phosphoglycolate phosphatase-like HAD superfamily hydrolase